MTDPDRWDKYGPTGTDAASRLSLGELTRAAGVSIRTVRYYIAEGLLPPPVGAGPRSAYTAAHLDRLRLIARLKTAYLPLKEIRRRLAGLSDAEVSRLLAEPAGGEPPPAAADSASDYLDRVLGPRAPRPAAPGAPSPAAPPAPAPVWEAMAEASAARASAESTAADRGTSPLLQRRTGSLGVAFPLAAAPPPATPEPAQTEPDAWRRIALGDDAEFLIRESAYRRRRDQVDWLIAWARRVFG